MRMTELGTLFSFINRGKAPVYVDESEVCIINQACIRWDKIDFDKVKYQDTAKVNEAAILMNGDLLIASTGTGTLGRCNVFQAPDERKYLTDTHVTIIRGNTGYSPYVIKYFMMRPDTQQKLYAQCVNGSTNQIELSRDKLRRFLVPELTTEEQIRFEKITNCLSKTIDLRQCQLRALDTLIKARFVEMFGDFKTNPMGWPVVGFEDIAIIDGNMTTDYERYADFPHIGIDSIEKETGLLKGYRTVAEDGVISGKYIFTPAHIIYSKIRPNLNKVALPDFEGLCSADAYPILPITGKCNRIFLAYDMRSTFFLDYILQFCNRTNLPKVNRKEVAGFRTPLPPIQLQDQFATFVSRVDKSKVVVQAALDKAQLLFDSLMQQYFG